MNIGILSLAWVECVYLFVLLYFSCLHRLRSPPTTELPSDFLKDDNNIIIDE